MIERVQRVTLEGGEGSERERKGAHTPPSLRQDRLNDPLPLRHTEIKKKLEHRRESRHESPSRELPPFFHLDAFSLLIRASIFLQLFSILCLFLFPFIALHFFDFSSSDTYTHTLSLFSYASRFSFLRFLSLPGQTCF